MAYQVDDGKFMYQEADIRTFESLCLDSFHDLHGHDRPKGAVWISKFHRNRKRSEKTDAKP
jgi:hypothetical protein